MFWQKAFSSVPLWLGASAWLAVMIQEHRERKGERKRGQVRQGNQGVPGGGPRSVLWGGEGVGTCAVKLGYFNVPLLCLIISMSALRAV